MDSQIVLAGGLNQSITKELIVRIGGKNDLPVIATLDGVLRLAGNDVARETCHRGFSYAEK
jgi:hypothetical protein